MNRLEFVKPLKKEKKPRKRAAVAALVAFGLGGVAAIAVGLKVRGDPEVMSDIDRHFDELDRWAPAPSEYSGSPGAGAPFADDGNQRNFSFGRRTDESGVSRRVAASVKHSRKKKPGERNTQMDDPLSDSVQKSRWQGIQMIGPGTYVIDAELFEQAKGNPGKFAGGARAKVAQAGGESVGFKIGGLEKDGAIRALGFLNGDVITSVNGHQLSSADEALAAAAAARFSTKFRVDILRGGQKLSLYYKVE